MLLLVLKKLLQLKMNKYFFERLNFKDLNFLIISRSIKRLKLRICHWEQVLLKYKYKRRMLEYNSKVLE